jgi:hypothetical protein
MELFKASNQWMSRPNEERFWNVREGADAARAYRDQAVTSTVNYNDLRVEAGSDGLYLTGRTGASAQISNWAFGQLSSKVKAPASYLRNLPATLAAQNLNHGLKNERDADDTARLLFHRNGGMLLRAALSDRYERIWNHELLDQIAKLENQGWRTPPARPARKDPRTRPATQADVLATESLGGLSIKVGDPIAPAGVYVSDRDMFVILINEAMRLDDGTDDGLISGLMLWNSEVGDKALGGMRFNLKTVCGNHIIWGASGVEQFSIRHVGDARFKTWRKLNLTMRELDDASFSEDEAIIKRSREVEIASNKQEVIETVTRFAANKKLKSELSEDRLGRAFDLAEMHRDWYGVAPTTVFGMLNGMTEVAQEEKFTAKRTKIDRAAGRILEMAF